MPVAAAAALVGVASYAATGSVWLALARVGLMAASHFLMPGERGPVNAQTSDSGSTVPPVDGGLGFAPFPQYPTPESPVPIIYGQARPNGLVVHSRVYGGDYQKAHYIAVFGEVGTTLDQLYIDKYRIEDLPNYYLQTGGSQTSESSWYNFYPQGGEASIALDNNGAWNIFRVTNVIGEIAAPVPVMFYGGGSVVCHSYHTWPKEGSDQSWKWVLTNIDDPADYQESAVFTETFQSSQTVSSSCFPAGTKVTTPSGEKAIETLAVGDAVLAFDADGRLHEGRISQTFRHNSPETLIHIRAGGLFLTATDNHWILVHGRGFIEAGDVEMGDVVFHADGTPLLVTVIQRERFDRIRTFNLEVEPHHTFIAGGVRVHNGGGGGKGSSSSTIYVPGNDLRTHTFTVPDPLTRWALKLVVSQLTNGTAGGQTGIYKFDINDVPFTESVRVNAAFAHIHLVKDVSISDNNPVLNALVHTSAVSGLGGNPANAMQTFLTDPVLGLGLPGDDIDFQSVLDTAYWCEEQGYGFNRAYAAFYDAEQVFREICAAGRIMVLSRNGRMFLKPDDVEPVTYKVGEREIIPGSLRVGIHSASRPNRIEAQYVEPFYGHTTERLYVEDLDAIARDGQQVKTIDLTGVTSQSQAFRLAWFILRTIQECPYWCKFKIGMETARLLAVGSVIEMESSTNTIANARQWRVLAIEETEAFVHQVECIQYSDSVYAEPAFSPWYNQVTDLVPVHGWPGPPEGPAQVVNFQIVQTDFPLDGISTEVTVDWGQPTERYETAIIQWSHDGLTWNPAGSGASGPLTFTWPMRYGVLHIRALSSYNGSTNEDSAPSLTRYVTGLEDNDFPGYGRGQYGWQPYGY